MRGIGWAYIQVSTNDSTHLFFAEKLEAETAGATVRFIERVFALCRAHGIRVRGLLSDSSSYHYSLLVRALMRRQGLRQRFRRPYTPRSQGKAVRFILTCFRSGPLSWAPHVRHPRVDCANTCTISPRSAGMTACTA